jgi:hypothetical protein
MNDDAIPVVEIYRGIGLHDQQSPERLIEVRRTIDAVYDQHDLNQLLEIAGDPTWPPEARLFAAAKLEATHQIAADERKVRPLIDLELVQACVAGLGSKNWRHPTYYASVLDPGPAPGKVWVKRERPLAD